MTSQLLRVKSLSGKTRHYINGVRVRDSQYEQVTRGPYVQLFSFVTTIHKGIIRHYCTAHT